MAHNVRWAVALAAALAAAGCADPSPSIEGGTGSTADAVGASLAGGLASVDASFAVPARNATVWANGTVGPTQTLACVGGCTWPILHDLSPAIPQGSLARVLATLSWDPAQDAAGAPVGATTLWLDVLSPDDEMVDYSYESRAGQVAVEAVVAHHSAGKVEAGIYRNFFGTSADVPYTLKVEVGPTPLLSHSGAPLALRRDPSATVLEVTAAQAGGSLKVWDGADRLLGRFPIGQGTRAIDLRNASGGELVLQFAGLEPGLRLAVRQDPEGTAPQLRLLRFERLFGPPHEVPPQGAVDWTFQVAAVPLWLGMYVDDGGDGVMSVNGATGSIRSPGGTVVEMQWDCGLCGGQGRFGGAADSPALVPGDYQAHFQHQAAASVSVGEYRVAYVR